MSDIKQLLNSLSEPEKNAIEVIKTFIGIYTPMNEGDGDGLFSGIERYRKLADRLPQAAISSQTLYDFWSKLRLKMHVSMPPTKATELLLPLWGLPNQLAILNRMVNQGNELIQVALAIYREEVAARKSKWAELNQVIEDAAPPPIPTEFNNSLSF